jgi:hypothetical protein
MPPYEPHLIPTRCMSRGECDTLFRDLVRAGIRVVRVEEPSPPLGKRIKLPSGRRFSTTKPSQ